MNYISVKFDRVKGRLATGLVTNRAAYMFNYNNCGYTIHYVDDARVQKAWLIREPREFGKGDVPLIGLPVLKDLTKIPEDEYFQYSLVWEHEIPMQLVHAIQKMNVHLFKDDVLQDDYHSTKITIEY